jgi:hypothetical protein
MLEALLVRQRDEVLATRLERERQRRTLEQAVLEAADAWERSPWFDREEATALIAAVRALRGAK